MRKYKLACTTAASFLAVLAGPSVAGASVTSVGPISMSEILAKESRASVMVFVTLRRLQA
ncbi:MAG: hypothetical protein EON59_11440 [Alphaproteobacteria bacterium]|nr:MAG: hypothetical protein EON59_11440 [Alphaproteobacteria bacterium]